MISRTIMTTITREENKSHTTAVAAARGKRGPENPTSTRKVRIRGLFLQDIPVSSLHLLSKPGSSVTNRSDGSGVDHNTETMVGKSNPDKQPQERHYSIICEATER